MSKVISLERAAWESFFWPENVTRRADPPKSGELDRAWAGRVKESPDSAALITDTATASYTTLDSAAAVISQELPVGCQYVVVVLQRDLVLRQAAILAARRVGAVPILVDGQSDLQALSSLGLSSSKSVVIGDSDIEIGGAKKVSTKRVQELSSGGAGGGASLQAGTESEGKAARLICKAEDGSPAWISEKIQGSRINSVKAFFSIADRPIIFYAGRTLTSLGELALDVALNLGGTLISAESIAQVASIMAAKKVRPDYGFYSPSEDAGGVGSVGGLGADRNVFQGCRWLLTSVVNPQRQVQLERSLHIPVLGCYSSTRTGVVIANHYSWNVHGSLGIPITNAEAAILGKEGVALPTNQPGELVVTGQQVDIEHAPDKVKEGSGWLKTGLVAEVDLSGIIRPSA